MTTLPLDGIRILDLSRLLPGPYLTQLLADLGAEVIKIETPLIGDYARMVPAQMGLSGMFESINRGKKSVALNYRNKQGREIFLKLSVNADVVLEGFRPGRMDKLGLGYEAVRAVNPDIVYCSLSSYGQDGPYRDRAGHDPIYLALGGALALNARQDEKPAPYGLPAADLSGGMLAAIAILGALVGRERTGRGLYLDMALLDGVISWMTPLAISSFLRGSPISAGTHPLLGGLPSFNNIYETLDHKFLVLGALEPTFWADFCSVLDRPDWLPRQFDRTLGEEIAVVFRTKTRLEWINAFSNTDGCVEPINTIEETLEHPQVKARGYIGMKDGKNFGINSTFCFARREMEPSPTLGQHTRQFLQEVGLSAHEIEELGSKKIIGLA